MPSMRLDAQDAKFQSTRPPRRPDRRSDQPHVKAYLRTVRPDDDAAADAALRAYEQETSC